jgi:hypothetical protein
LTESQTKIVSRMLRLLNSDSAIVAVVDHRNPAAGWQTVQSRLILEVPCGRRSVARGGLFNLLVSIGVVDVRRASCGCLTVVRRRPSGTDCQKCRMFVAPFQTNDLNNRPSWQFIVPRHQLPKSPDFHRTFPTQNTLTARVQCQLILVIQSRHNS